jgi:hypothetical protein
MRSKLAERLARRQLIPILGPQFAAKGRLVHHTHLEWLLRALTFEDTGDAGGESFYFWVFVQPLYHPAQYVTLSIGHRLGDRAWQLVDGGLPPALVETAASEGLRFLNRIEQPVDLASYLQEDALREAPENALLREDAAYSLLLAGDTAGAADHLARIEAAYRDRTPSYDSERELLARIAAMRAAMQEGGDAPVRLLRLYRNETVAHLGLESTLEPN